MKNKKVILTSISFLLVLTIIIVYTNKEEDTSFQDDNTKQVVEENTLSMMIEQTAGAEDYKLETRSSWPTSGYVFNTTLSKCENVGELSWDDTYKVVLFSSSSIDSCYVYFDVYSSTVVNSFTYTATKTSLTITAKVTKGSHDISKYYFSINNGNYYESSTNTYTFSNLSAGTTYTIKVKTKDSLNKESSVYSGTAKITAITLADYIKGLYTTQGANGLYHHDGTLENGIDDGSYRYAGSNPNNYVCFGLDDATWPDDNKYRIIGVFGDQVKLIKATVATSTY